jgi:hypothetical protein
MPNQSRKVKPLFEIETKKRKPLFVLAPPTKQKPLLQRFEKDDDMNFIMDTYQTGLSPFPMNDCECKARQAMLKRIARKRKPHVVPLLEQIEDIVEKNRRGQLDTKTAMHRLLAISEKHSHPALHQGILAKIGMISPQGRPQRSLGIFAMEQKPRPTLSDFLKSNSKQKTKTGKAKGWDPWKDEHPLARAMKNSNKRKTKKKIANKKTNRKITTLDQLLNSKTGKMKNTGWDPLKDKHPLAIMMEQQNKKHKRRRKR